jgi:23S rRNA (guanosine2251-2'-O)-methyltransferase
MTKRKTFKTHKTGKGKPAGFKGAARPETPRHQSAAKPAETDRKFRGKPAPSAKTMDRHVDNRPRSDRPGSGAAQRLTGRPPREDGGREPSGSGYWLFGHHAVAAAMANPDRRIHRLVQVGTAGDELPQPKTDDPLPRWETIDREAMDHIVGRDAVHQGIAARVAPLPEHHIDEVADLAKDLAGEDKKTAVVLILDQVTDPHNVGAILRSAAAFGAIAVVLTERHAAPETGVLAKAASGALEHVPIIRVTNLVRAMEDLKQAGFWCVGLAAEAERTLAENKLTGRVALCLGAEGPGLRRLTREHCDLLAKLPTSGPIDHLNVSNAAAVSLYELMRR